MRSIDNYTDKEREVLALKGMTAPRTASERNKARPKIVVKRDMTPDYEREAQRDRDRLQSARAQESEPAPNKAQHSDLVGSPHESPDTTGRQAKHEKPLHKPPYSFSGIVGDDYIMAQGTSGREKVAEVWNWRDKEYICRAVNHADKLAEALRHTRARLDYLHKQDVFHSKDWDAITQADEALAAYEAAQ